MFWNKERQTQNYPNIKNWIYSTCISMTSENISFTHATNVVNRQTPFPVLLNKTEAN